MDLSKKTSTHDSAGSLTVNGAGTGTGNQNTDAEAAMERKPWGSQLEFILTLVGYAVGLGNVWRFPYLCYKNGGGAFLIPYFLMLLIVGFPIFFLEVAIGQFASLGPLAIWSVNPLLKGLGYSMVITNTLIALYYNVIIAWTTFFFFASMTSQLPWETCDNWWNTDYCILPQYVANLTGNTTVIGNETVPRAMLKTPSEEYFFNNVLRISESMDDMGGVVWQLALCLLFAWTVIYIVLVKGIYSLGKVVYFSSIFPYVLLTVMLIRGVTLPGASTGIAYYLKPDFSRLTDATVWTESATQIFYSLSTCTGGLIAMASYNKFGNNCKRDSLLVPIINCLTSFYAGFVVFSVLGYMAQLKGVSVDEVAQEGPGLVFVVYPEGLSQMPIAPLWSILFFFMMMTLGFSSEFSMTECFLSSVLDEFSGTLKTSAKREYAVRAFFILIFFAIGLSMVTNGGFYLFDIFNTYTGSFPLLFVGLFEIIGLMYIYEIGRFAEDVRIMTGSDPNIYYKVTLFCLSPVVLLAVIIFTSIQWKSPDYPAWGNAIGWIIVSASVAPVPIFFFVNLYRGQSWKPLNTWGPALSENRKDTRYDQDNDHSNNSGGMINMAYVPEGAVVLRSIRPNKDFE